ncbi:MAG: secretin N-terminal domain-containing protein [Pyrinomonadaceae bacterium]
MKRSIYVRFSLTFLLVFSMLSPAAVLAMGDGKKRFKKGMAHEAAEVWDQAAEEFALAVAEDPKNPEYRLHLQRALFNASQMYMKKGRTAAENKDYEGAYIAFRKAYAFDPVNELAKSEMARMVRMQQGVIDEANPEGNKTVDNGKVKLVQTGYNAQKAVPDPLPQKLEQIRQVPFPGGVNLQFIVKELAKDLDLNVLFDAESRLEGRSVRIDLKNVTSAKALDYIFLQENLFFQKVGPRTILVATGLRRTNFQQLVLRTFYLANASPKDVKGVITAAIPAQPGRSQTIVLEDASTNSITIRDTKENIQLIGKLIASLDKDRAEVVMDVAIYEVNKSDLLQFGNQLGTTGTGGSLTNIGGFQLPFATSGTTQSITSGLPFKGIDLASIAIGLPISSIAALQTKSNTKLLASTQIHAFNNEDSSARIGQRVPVKTASFQTGVTNNGGGGVTSDVINYEQVGLTLKFKPIVFPNQDVQVAMEIESKDVAGAQTLTPTFTERTIKGTARVQNNKTLLLASVAQNIESNGRSGLPLLGLIPIIGRLFTAPTKDNRQVDIVIAITPRVIRAPAILPEDEIERDTGSLQTPTSGSLEAMIVQEEREELLATARRLPTTANVQLPDQSAENPTYVRTGAADPNAQPAKVADNTSANTKTIGDALNLRPIDTGVKTLQIMETSDTSKPSDLVVEPIKTPETSVKAPEAEKPVVATPSAELQLPASLPELKAGEKTKIAVMVKSSSAFRSAVLGLRFDDKKLAVRSVSFGDIFGTPAANTAVLPFLNEKGKMFVSLSLPQGTVATQSGVLAIVEIEALADGKVEISLEKDVLNMLAADGKTFAIKL